MNKVEAGAAVIRIEAENATEPAFQGVAESLDNFQSQIANFESNLKPFQEIMKGGMMAGGMTAGFGLLMEESSKVSGAISAIDDSFTDLGTNAEGTIGKIVGLLRTNPFVEWGSKIVAFSAAGMAALQILQQLYASTVAITAVLKAWYASAVLASTGTGIYATVCAAATTAVNTLTIAMAANPITFWAVAMTAAIAAIGGLIWWFASSTKAADENTTAINRQNEALQKAIDNYGRLSQINDKKRNIEYQRAELNGDTEEDLVWLQNKKAREKKVEIEEQIVRLKHVAYGSNNGDERQNAKDQIADLKQELEQIDLDIAKRNQEIEEKLEAQREQYASKKKQREKEHDDFIQNGLNLQAQMQKELASEGMTQLEKEKLAIQDRINQREKELQQAVNEGKITENERKKELEALNRVASMQIQTAERRDARRRKDEADREAAKKAAEETARIAEADRVRKEKLSRIQSNLTVFLQERQAAAGPITASQSGTAEAYKQFLENQNRGKNDLTPDGKMTQEFQEAFKVFVREKEKRDETQKQLTEKLLDKLEGI